MFLSKKLPFVAAGLAFCLALAGCPDDTAKGGGNAKGTGGGNTNQDGGVTPQQKEPNLWSVVADGSDAASSTKLTFTFSVAPDPDIQPDDIVITNIDRRVHHVLRPARTVFLCTRRLD